MSDFKGSSFRWGVRSRKPMCRQMSKDWRSAMAAMVMASASILLVAQRASADDPSSASSGFLQTKLGGLNLTFGGKAGLGYVATGNTNFGDGFRDRGKSVDHDVDYGEGFVEPRLDLDYQTEKYGEFYGAVAAIGAQTIGGDPGGYTSHSPNDVSVGQLFAGWKSGDLLSSSFGKDALTVSGGRQDFHIGDGFLVWDGNFDAGGDGAYWLAPRTAFDNTTIVTLNTGPVHADTFYLKSDKDNDHSELAGTNVEYHKDGFGTLGATYFNIFDSDDKLYIRKGMNVASMRVSDIKIPSVDGLTVRGEYAREWGGRNGIKTDAYGWYAEIDYSLASYLPWSPTLSYRYSAFSGDSNPDNKTNTSFDPLFFGAGRGWGTWYQGEIVGEYLLFNSNNRVNTVQLNVKPADSLSTGLIYFNFSLDKGNYGGSSVKSKSFANEVDLYADWSVNDHLYMGAVGGIGFAGAAAKQAFGNNDVYQLAEFIMTVTY